MAAIYPLGTNRIFYKASPKSNLDLPDKVTVDLIEDNIDPELINVVTIDLIAVVSVPTLYYFEAEFLEAGTYIAVFYEWRDEVPVEKASQAFSTRKIPTISSGGFRPSSLGPNVI